MGDDTTFPNVDFSFFESRKNPNFLLKLVVGGIFGKSPESLKRLLLGRHRWTVECEAGVRKAWLLPNVSGAQPEGVSP